jgi:molybdopterin-binding protein
VQQGEPQSVFRKPVTPYIADFLGAENVFSGIVRSVDTATDRIAGREDEFGKRAVEFTTGRLTFYALGDITDGPVHAVIRAEEVSLSMETSVSSVTNQFHGRIIELVPAGALTRVTVEVNGTPIVAAITTRSARDLSLALGTEIVAAFKATAIHFC